MVRKLLAAVCGLLRGGDAPAEDGVRTSPSPINGVATEVRFVMRHPQFEADIVEASEGGLQWTDPNPSPAQLAARMPYPDLRMERLLVLNAAQMPADLGSRSEIKIVQP